MANISDASADSSVFYHPQGTITQKNVWQRQTYPRASRMSPESTTSLINFGNPSLHWITIIVLIILNSILFILYVLDAVGVGFRSPITLVATSGALFLLFCCLSLYAVFKFKYERLMQDWLRMVYISTTFTFINLVSFLSFLIWALQNPGFWKKIDFEDHPKAHDGYVAINAFSAAIFVMALLILWTAIVVHYYFVKLLQTLNITITKAGNSGNLFDIMSKVSEGGKKVKPATHIDNNYNSPQRQNNNINNQFRASEELEAAKWRE